MTPEDYISRLHAELQRRFRNAGRGSVRRVQTALGLSDAYFRVQRQRGRLDLRILLEALELLEVEPADFFGAVLGPVDPVAAFRAEAAALRRRAGCLPRILHLEARRDPGGAQSHTVELEALDARRDDDPRWVLREATEHVVRVPDSQVPALLGVYASAAQGVGELDRAQLVLARAMQLAANLGDAAGTGQLLLRATSIVGDRGQYERALALAEKAALSFVVTGDEVGIAKALVKQGMACGCLDRFSEEVATCRRALQLLRDQGERIEIRRYRYAGLVNLAVAYHGLGKLEQAERFAGQGREAAKGLGAALVGKLVWLQGSIAKERGQNRRAERHFSQALEVHQNLSPLSAALLGVELARVQVLQGRWDRARETVLPLAALLRKLKKNRVATAALTELLRCATASRRLSEEMLEPIASSLEKARELPAGSSRDWSF